MDEKPRQCVKSRDEWPYDVEFGTHSSGGYSFGGAKNENVSPRLNLW